MSVYFITIISVFILTSMARNSGYYVQTIYGEYSYIKSPQCKLFLSLSALGLISVAGLRYHVGTDFGSYERLFISYSSTPFKELMNLDEPILPLIGKLCGSLGGSAQTMFYVVSFLTIGLALYSTYKETDNFTYVTLMYIFVGCWHGSFNGIRQYLAITLIFVARSFIRDRKLAKYIVVCFLAFLCHKSAIVFIPLYFIYSRQISWNRVLLVVVGTIILSQSTNVLFSIVGWLNSAEFVMTEYSSTAVNVFRVAVRVAPAILGIYYAQTRKLDDEQVFYFYLLLTQAAVGITTGQSAYLARMGAYTASFVPLGLNSITKATSSRYYKLFRALVMVLFFLYWLYDITNSTTLREYEWILGR